METLALAFRMVANECHQDLKTSLDRNHRSYSWIAVSHVCKYWRDASLSFPTVWSSIASNSPKFAKLCLERSKTVPIDVHLRFDPAHDLFTTIQPHASRIRDLTVIIEFPSWKISIRSFVDLPAPILQSLKLQVSTRSPPYFPLLFRDHTPSLKHLTIEGYSLPPPANHFVNLVRLDLRNDVHRLVPMSRFLDALESNPGLLHLTVSFAGPKSDDIDPTWNRVVRLDSVQLVDLHECFAKLLLGHLMLSSGTELVIYNSSRLLPQRGGSTVVEDMLPESLTNLRNLQNLDVLGIARRGRYDWEIAGGRKGHGAKTSVSITHDADGRTSSTGPPSFFPLLVVEVHELWLKKVTIEYFDFDAAEFVVDLRRTFSALPALQTLVLLQCRADCIFQALQPNEDHIPCSSLTALVIYDPFEIDDFGDAELIDLACARKQYGAPLKRISLGFRPGTVSLGDQVERLKEYVEVVDYEESDSVRNWPFR